MFISRLPCLYRGVGRRKLPISFIKEVTDRCLMVGNESSLLWKADVADLLELSVRYSNPDKSARKFIKNFTEHEKVLIYLSIHQLKSNIPDQFITSLCNCFSSICDEIYRLSRFYLSFHSLLEINHAVSLKSSNWMRVYYQGVTKAVRTQVMRISNSVLLKFS